MVFEMIILWAMAAFMLGLTAIFLPKIFIGIVIVLALGCALDSICRRMDEHKEKHRSERVEKSVKDRFPDASEQHQHAIIDKVMAGASIDSFKIEDGRIWTVQNKSAKYLRASGAWLRDPMNMDAAQLYAAERLQIDQAYTEFGFTPAQVHELSVNLYFNWQIMSVSRVGKSVEIELHRRGDNRRLVFS